MYSISQDWCPATSSTDHLAANYENDNRNNLEDVQKNQVLLTQPAMLSKLVKCRRTMKFSSSTTMMLFSLFCILSLMPFDTSTNIPTITSVQAQKKYWPKADRKAYDEYHAAKNDPTIDTKITRWGNLYGNLKKAFWDKVYIKVINQTEEALRLNVTDQTTQAEMLDAIGANDSTERRRLQQQYGRDDGVILDLTGIFGVQLITDQPSCWINWMSPVQTCDEANICQTKEMMACLAYDEGNTGFMGFYHWVSLFTMWVIYGKLYVIAKMVMLCTQ